MLHADLGQNVPAVFDEQDVDTRVHRGEHLGEMERAARVVVADRLNGGAVFGEHPRREGQVGEAVVELGLEGALRVDHPVVDLVDELPVEQPRQHG